MTIWPTASARSTWGQVKIGVPRTGTQRPEVGSRSSAEGFSGSCVGCGHETRSQHYAVNNAQVGGPLMTTAWPPVCGLGQSSSALLASSGQTGSGAWHARPHLALVVHQDVNLLNDVQEDLRQHPTHRKHITTRRGFLSLGACSTFPPVYILMYFAPFAAHGQKTCRRCDASAAAPHLVLLVLDALSSPADRACDLFRVSGSTHRA